MKKRRKRGEKKKMIKISPGWTKLKRKHEKDNKKKKKKRNMKEYENHDKTEKRKRKREIDKLNIRERWKGRT